MKPLNTCCLTAHQIGDLPVFAELFDLQLYAIFFALHRQKKIQVCQKWNIHCTDTKDVKVKYTHQSMVLAPSI